MHTPAHAGRSQHYLSGRLQPGAGEDFAMKWEISVWECELESWVPILCVCAIDVEHAWNLAEQLRGMDAYSANLIR